MAEGRDWVELTSALLDVQSDWAQPARAETYEVVDWWRRERSGSSFVHLVGVPNGPEILTKTVDGWESSDARDTHDAMADLAGALAAASIPSAAGISPLGWIEGPPTVVMPWVEGRDAVTILRSNDRETIEGRMPNWLSSAGAMLAAFHATTPDRDFGDASKQAIQAAGRLRIDGKTATRLMDQVQWQGKCARSFGDIGPGNLHVTPTGEIYLVDPPVETSLALIHRDLGNFVFELRRQLAGRGYTRTSPIRGRFDHLSSTFLDGYIEQSGRDLGAADHALIALFEARRALGMARKRLPSRPGDALWFSRLALSRRRDVLDVFERTR